MDIYISFSLYTHRKHLLSIDYCDIPKVHGSIDAYEPIGGGNCGGKGINAMEEGYHIFMSGHVETSSDIVI